MMVAYRGRNIAPPSVYWPSVSKGEVPEWLKGLAWKAGVP